MIVSVSFVWVLTIWCFRKVLSAPAEPAEQVKQFHNA